MERSKAELSEILASAAASGFLKQNSTDLVGLIALMTTISNARPVGRLVTELTPAKFKDSPTLDVVLEDGDAIYIPEIQNTITKIIFLPIGKEVIIWTILYGIHIYMY